MILKYSEQYIARHNKTPEESSISTFLRCHPRKGTFKMSQQVSPPRRTYNSYVFSHTHRYRINRFGAYARTGCETRPLPMLRNRWDNHPQDFPHVTFIPHMYNNHNEVRYG